MVYHKKQPRLGQHFLTRPEIAARVADAAEVGADDTVVEVGPGRGILTDILLTRAKRVVAVEKDPALVRELEARFAPAIASSRLELLTADIRSFEPVHHGLVQGGYKVVANIPYYITGELFRKFLTNSAQPRTLAFLIQKEVAERIVAKNGKESLLSLSIKAYGTPTYVHTVKAGSFSPPPKVDSAIVAIHDISRVRFSNPEEEVRFFDLLHAGFGSKRKILKTTLGNTVAPEAWKTCAIDEKARPETLTLDAWLCLARAR